MEFIKVGGDWRESDQFVKVDNQWRKVEEAYVKINNQWRVLADPNIPQAPIVFMSTSVGQHGAPRTWIVPAEGVYRVSAFGAQGGGNGVNNYGAMASGEFFLQVGQRVDMVVGQRGIYSPTSGGNFHVGGGGGTFVVLGEFRFAQERDILSIGGGGGGIIRIDPRNAGGVSATHGASGTHGNGGSNGANGTVRGVAHGGKGFNSVRHDPSGIGRGRGFGGYGGGGGVTGGWFNRCGGGGGYSGGGPGGPWHNNPVAGGGGGSYTRGSNPIYRHNIQFHGGKVVIEYIRRFF